MDDPAEVWDDDGWPGEAVWCERCQGMGSVNCYCGGDLCVCENYGEADCPRCHGEGAYVPKASHDPTRTPL